MADSTERAMTPGQRCLTSWRQQPQWSQMRGANPLTAQYLEDTEDEAAFDSNEEDDEAGPSHASVLALCSSFRVRPPRHLVGRAMAVAWVEVC